MMPVSSYADRALLGRPRTAGKLGSFTRSDCCPACGQRLPDNIRYGVRLPPIKLQLFDAVKRQPGIGQRGLFAKMYPGKDYNRERHKSTISTHVAQINDLFVHTDIRIVGKPYSGYKVVGL